MKLSLSEIAGIASTRVYDLEEAVKDFVDNREEGDWLENENETQLMNDRFDDLIVSLLELTDSLPDCEQLIARIERMIVTRRNE